MNVPKRKATRLPGHDYSNENYYFITICTHEKTCIFGTVDQLNVFGMVAEEDLLHIDAHYTGVRVDKAIVMPNHVHAIIVIGCRNEKAEHPSLNTILGQYKSGVTRKLRTENPEMIVWQRSYHDHIICDRADYERIWQYIDSNAQKWESDCFYVK